MKIQDLAIIFIIIILPISLALSLYTQFQIETLNLQTTYDTKLTSATFDAIKAFQLNTANSTMSEISNSKIRDIEASVSTFKRSLMSTFGLNGYTEEDLNTFIPALVYTMYDGFYLYAPHENKNYLYKVEKDAAGNIVTDGAGNPIYETDVDGNKIPIDDNEETIYGLKPYIHYSSRYYIDDDNDFVITYALDNYIVIQGKINGNYVNDEGYLIDGIEIVGDINTDSYTLKYNGIGITGETNLTEFVGGNEYPYIKMNGTKYYYDSANREVFYLRNGERATQYKGDIAENFYNNTIATNSSAREYYKKAYLFTERVRGIYNLDELEFQDSQIYITIEKDDGTKETRKKFEGDTRKIFAEDTNTNIECRNSNFNQHRLAIIRNTIEENLAVAISNYNIYSGVAATGIEFQMPELKEDEWDFILNNISLISFVQGLNIGGKTYNGYTIVNNSETKELVSEENIYILGADGTYHRIGDNYLTAESTGANIRAGIPAGRLNLDFKRKSLIQSVGTGQVTSYYYPRIEDASYNSIITQNDVTTFEDIYKYIEGTNDTLKKAFYTALGREREGMYKTLRTDML